jgi:hypothetical protein
MASDIGEVPSGGARAAACDAPVAGGGGRSPARAEALDRRRPAEERGGTELVPAGEAPGAQGRTGEERQVEVPGQAAGKNRAQHSPDRAHHAHGDGEKCLPIGDVEIGPGAEKSHQSAAY